MQQQKKVSFNDQKLKQVEQPLQKWPQMTKQGEGWGQSMSIGIPVNQQRKTSKYMYYIGIVIAAAVIVGSYFIQSDYWRSQDDTRRQVKKSLAAFLVIASLIAIAFMVYQIIKK